MRGGLVAALFLLAGCNPGVPQPSAQMNKAEPVRNVLPSAPVNETAALNEAEPASAEPPPGDPGLASMSPYRRREYERGYRDCMTGNFDGERQGESYRIGCMAAEEARERRSR